MDWGLLGPEVLSNQRRTRTLGLGRAVRRFNDLAVPGMGGVWYAKQLVLATLGVAVAEEARKRGRDHSNIVIANAVEAVACWLAYNGTNWAQNERLVGRLKMGGKTDLSFENVSRAGFYVTQPMRLRAVEPLLALGFVEASGERFNAYRCTSRGQMLLEASLGSYRPNNRSVVANLLHWVSGDSKCVHPNANRMALSPLTSLQKSGREFLRECLVNEERHGSRERRNALAWVEQLRQSKEKISWDHRPSVLEPDHWDDLRIGGRFFVTRQAAIEALDVVENNIGTSDQQLVLKDRLPTSIEAYVSSLQQRAKEFLSEERDPSPDKEATKFCRECTSSGLDEVLASLVKRDERVLQLRGGNVVAGPAFKGGSQAEAPFEGDAEPESEAPLISSDIRWPAGISGRMKNLFWFAQDLNSSGKGNGVSAADEEAVNG